MDKVLFVDLSDGKIEEETPDEKLYRDFLGGYGLGARIIYSRQKPGADPLGPENHLGFVTGPLTGIKGLQGSRFTVVGKSPLTGGWGDANCGGYFGPFLKFSGHDAVFFKGISPEPVYLYIDDGRAELRSADHLWGKDALETEKLLKSELGEKTAVACIGPAAEKKSFISCIMHDVGCAAARSGLGAVMGSKKLKAVAVTGTKEVPVPDKERVAELFKEYLGMLSGDYYETYKKYGTCGIMFATTSRGDAPVKNWAGVSSVDFPNVKTISDDAVLALQEKKHGCLWCPIACKGMLKKGKAYPYESGVHKPEYETLAAFGSLLLNDHAESIVRANDICNRYGLDTISAGAAIAFAMECYEKGILTKADIDGIDLAWGNHEAIIEMTERLARREGFGDVLADGVKKAAEKIGKGSEDCAIHAGGQELAMHDPRYMLLYATFYECDATPGRHTAGFADAKSSSSWRVMNASGMCMFAYICAPGVDLARFVTTATGWDFTSEELTRVGLRISNIRQAFNVREGIKPGDFRITSGRPLGDPPLKEGPTADTNVTTDAEGIRAGLFKSMDWDTESGKPSREKLLSLGLDDVAADLWPNHK